MSIKNAAAIRRGLFFISLPMYNTSCQSTTFPIPAPLPYPVGKLAECSTT